MSRIPVPNGGLHHVSSSPTHSPMSSQNNTPAAAADTRRKQSRRDEVSPSSSPSTPPSRPSFSAPEPHLPPPCLPCLASTRSHDLAVAPASEPLYYAHPLSSCFATRIPPPSLPSLPASVHSRPGAIRGSLQVPAIDSSPIPCPKLAAPLSARSVHGTLFVHEQLPAPRIAQAAHLGSRTSLALACDSLVLKTTAAASHHHEAGLIPHPLVVAVPGQTSRLFTSRDQQQQTLCLLPSLTPCF